MAIANFFGGFILLIIGLIIHTGKAAFLIAGYNTMSPEEQALWDIKKISRFLGWIFILSALVLIVGGALGQWAVHSFAVTMGSYGLGIVIILCGAVYMNVSRRFRTDVVHVDTKNLFRGKGQKQIWILVPVILVVVGAFVGTGYLLIASSKPPVYTVSDTSLKISGMYGETITLSDIVNMRLEDNLPSNLLRTNGSNDGTHLKGNFKSHGTRMKIFVDASKPPFIYLDTSEGLVILNDQSADRTKALFQQLQEKTSRVQSSSGLRP